MRPAIVVVIEFLRSGRAWERLRRAYAFLLSRRLAAGLGDRSDANLTARLTYALNGELKIGLRVLIVGIGTLGGWAILVPLSGAVIVPGTLVVESDVKKIQHPSGGVVANIPVRDGIHVRAGDLLLHLDETQLRANAQVAAQQLDQMRVRLARLIAERDGMDEPQVPREMANRLTEDAVSAYGHRKFRFSTVVRPHAAAQRSSYAATPDSSRNRFQVSTPK